MKKHILLSMLFIGSSLLVITSCIKRTANVAPERDTEFQSSIDATYAAQVITDVEMICSFIAVDDLSPKFYMNAAGTPNSVTPSRSQSGDYIFIGFNSTKCLDGRVRDGSIAMYCASSNPNATYYHDYQFQGKVSLLNYKVDGWSVDLKNSFIISNLLTSPVFDPAKTNLSWSLKGDFVLKHPTDSTRNIHCNVDLVKTLSNTGDKNVFNPAKSVATITWSLATANYSGMMFGETSRTAPFKFNINESNPMVRDFTCFPDKVAGVSATPGYAPQIEEFHPFVKGLVSFTTKDLYPREISYGDEQATYHDVKNSPLTLTPQCDNKGIVTIKGISYPIDFVKEYK